MSTDPQPTESASASELAQPAMLVVGTSLRWIEHTPARLWAGRAGVSYRTGTALELRRDHAAAVDAVHAELDLVRDLGADFVRQFGLFEVTTAVASKMEYIARPDLGRRLSLESKELLWKRCPRDAGLQVVIGDGLSATAIASQVAALLPMLLDTAANRGWQIGQPFVVRHCRVGVLNDIGEQLDPQVVVLGHEAFYDGLMVGEVNRFVDVVGVVHAGNECLVAVVGAAEFDGFLALEQHHLPMQDP